MSEQLSEDERERLLDDAATRIRDLILEIKAVDAMTEAATGISLLDSTPAEFTSLRADGIARLRDQFAAFEAAAAVLQPILERSGQSVGEVLGGAEAPLRDRIRALLAASGLLGDYTGPGVAATARFEGVIP